MNVAALRRRVKKTRKSYLLADYLGIHYTNLHRKLTGAQGISPEQMQKINAWLQEMGA